MNILWVTNVPLPEYSQITQSNEIPYGGWLINTSIEVSRKADINLSVAFPIDEKVDLESSVSGEKINYHPFQTIRGDKELTKESLDRIKYILNIVKPDIVHLHGTESRHTYEFTKLCKELGVKTVISIQGLVSVIAKHMRANLPDSVYYGKTIRDWLRKASIYDLTNTYTKKGAYEIEALKLTNNVIGRTSWDKSNSLLINSNINYHHCNESLRDFFYNHKWQIDKCEEYTVFVSQGNYPVKGFHYMLKAAYLLKNKYPKLKVRIAGEDILNSDTILNRLKHTKYSKYIMKLIRRYNLEENIKFIGTLNEEQMGNEFLQAHVFVCPSTIENSPNSLGEAMIMGVPSVASYVGGIPDMLDHNKEGFLYQHDAPEMLAFYIDKIFEDDDVSLSISENSRKRALKTHDIEDNINKLIEIYGEVIYQ